MEPISQLDVQNPDHISVITRDGKVTISVTKDGASVTLGFPIRNALDIPPRPPLQQSLRQETGRGITKEEGLAYLRKLADQDREQSTTTTRIKPVGAPGSKHVRYQGPTPKLNPRFVREIKQLLNDENYMAQWGSKTRGYQAVGRLYNVTGCAISNIARGIAWSHIKV
jgi:hypothetical protein